jgi:hypothetical protein
MAAWCMGHTEARPLIDRGGQMSVLSTYQWHHSLMHACNKGHTEGYGPIGRVDVSAKNSAAQPLILVGPVPH